jgi:hypothetical protein
MSHSKRWRDALPTSFRSPFLSQGDLGYFSTHRKTYGGFFLAVNTFSGLIHVSKISNTKLETLVAAVGRMTKVKPGGAGGCEPKKVQGEFFVRTVILPIFARFFLTGKRD